MKTAWNGSRPHRLTAPPGIFGNFSGVLRHVDIDREDGERRGEGAEEPHRSRA
jgi:hypothetical protein